MRKTKIYLDTSVINYLDAPHMPQQMQDTLAFWDVLGAGEKFEVVFSDVLEREIRDCSEPKQDYLLRKMAEIPSAFISLTDEIVALANSYLDFGVLSAKNRGDLLHIACATVSGCKLIVSWNFKHFVNYKTMDRVNAVHLISGYDPVRIATPSMIMGELSYE